MRVSVAPHGDVVDRLEQPAITTTSRTATSTRLETHTCHLLDLPPELRNRVYSFVFKHTSETKNIDLPHAHEHAPGVALTLTNRQIHSETHAMYRKASSSFWNGHLLSISINCLALGETLDDKRDAITSALRNLRRHDPAMRVKWLILHIRTIFGRSKAADATVDVDHRGGKDRWVILTHTIIDEDVFQASLHEQLEDRRVNGKMRKGCVDVELYLRAACDAF